MEIRFESRYTKMLESFLYRHEIPFTRIKTPEFRFNDADFTVEQARFGLCENNADTLGQTLDEILSLYRGPNAGIFLHRFYFGMEFEDHGAEIGQFIVEHYLLQPGEIEFAPSPLSADEYDPRKRKFAHQADEESEPSNGPPDPEPVVEQPAEIVRLWNPPDLEPLEIDELTEEPETNGPLEISEYPEPSEPTVEETPEVDEPLLSEEVIEPILPEAPIETPPPVFVVEPASPEDEIEPAIPEVVAEPTEQMEPPVEPPVYEAIQDVPDPDVEPEPPLIAPDPPARSEVESVMERLGVPAEPKTPELPEISPPDAPEFIPENDQEVFMEFNAPTNEQTVDPAGIDYQRMQQDIGFLVQLLGKGLNPDVSEVMAKAIVIVVQDHLRSHGELSKRLHE
jgi:hypothetical protein